MSEQKNKYSALFQMACALKKAGYTCQSIFAVSINLCPPEQAFEFAKSLLVSDPDSQNWFAELCGHISMKEPVIAAEAYSKWFQSNLDTIKNKFLQEHGDQLVIEPVFEDD